MRRLRTFLLSNFEPVWTLIQRIPFLSRPINHFIINTAVKASRPRPHPFSTRSDYTSWASLTDRRYFARHLPPARPSANLADVSEVTELFARPEGGGEFCPKSTLLFPVFAQYLTDGFLRTDMKVRARTTSNHEIDLSPLYGRTSAQTDALRWREETPGRKGRLKSQELNGEEYPPYLYEEDGSTVRECFTGPNGKPILDPPLGGENIAGKGFERQIFAVGGDRVNATPMVTMLNTLLLREHNRLAGELEKRNGGWDDERIFQTARNILITIYIKIVIEEYINHISSTCFKLKADPKVAWTASWNRPNWMTVEFALLYRWHPLVPDHVTWAGESVPSAQMVLDNRYLTDVGLEAGFRYVSAEKVTALTLFNTPSFLLDVERRAIQQGRNLSVDTYNRYRDIMSIPKVTSFDQVTGNPKKREALKRVYGTPDAVEFYTGLFAEDVNPNTPMPTLIGAMVALDAFSQALTNPLLSANVYNETTFTDWGLGQIETTERLSDLLIRNVPASDFPDRADSIRMTRKDWRRQWVSF
ncbi:MAG: peroxidase family protein [Kiloniellales bacterium]